MEFNEKWENVDKTSLQKLVDRGLSTKMIAELYKMSYWSIYKKLKYYNINIPKYYYTVKKSPKIYKICKYCQKQYSNNNYGEYCSKTCLNFATNCNYDLSNINDLGKEIIKLHQSGLSYKQIKEIVHYSKSLIGYYCNPNYKKWCRNYSKSYKKRYGNLERHVSHFNLPWNNIGRPTMCKKMKKETRTCYL